MTPIRRSCLPLLLMAALAFVRAPLAHDVIGVSTPQLHANYWIRAQQAPERTVMDREAIAARNASLQRLDASVRDIASLPAQLAGDEVRGWITALSVLPEATLYGEDDAEIPRERLQALAGTLALEAIPRQQDARYALVTRRAALRTFPTTLRVFRQRGDHDIDRFQENALFPGTAVVVVHESRDGAWLFVLSDLYAAWLRREDVAEGSRRTVLDYGTKVPYLIVTGATARTVFTPEQPQVSELQLDMGVRVPRLAGWPGDRVVNGQHPFAAHVIELPIRRDDGMLELVPALLPRTADVAGDYLPLSEANLLRQGFKFLGERYGWGHDYQARDCSGFVSEVYRSFGVRMPRNTSDQAVSEAAGRIALQGMPREQRVALLRTLDVGDLVYIPGHVMMVIGQHDGMPYVIHDTTGISYKDARGETRRVSLNGVSVTPLAPLLLSGDRSVIDGITNIQRIRPPDTQDATP